MNMEANLTQLSIAELDQVIARATELRDQRRAEALERLRRDAEMLGASVVDSNGGKPAAAERRKHTKQPKRTAVAR